MDVISKRLLHIDRATVIKSGKRVLDNLSLSINIGQHTAIVGPNGSGKSSLIKLLTRQYYPIVTPDDRPTVSILGETMWDIFELRSKLGIVSADLYLNFLEHPDLTVSDIVTSGFFGSIGVAPHQTHLVTKAMKKSVRESLELVDATHLEHRIIGELSSGEGRRVIIARALVRNPIALVLDEPTVGLDMSAHFAFTQAVRHLAQWGITIVMVTHQIEDIFPEIEQVILIKNGGIIAHGSPQKMLTSESLSNLFDANIVVTCEAGAYRASVLERG